MTEPVSLDKGELTFSLNLPVLSPQVERLQLTNNQASPRLFKIMGSNIKAYVLSPHQGCLRPKESVSIKIKAIKENEQGESEEHVDRFAICSVPADMEVQDEKLIKQLIAQRAGSQHIAIFTARHIRHTVPKLKFFESQLSMAEAKRPSIDMLKSTIPINIGPTPLQAHNRSPTQFTFKRDSSTPESSPVFKAKPKAPVSEALKLRRLPQLPRKEELAKLQQERFLLENQLKIGRVRLSAAARAA